MLPLIIGQLDGGRADAATEPTGRSDIEDAEIADRPA
jgi:hypothetical protein